MSNPTYWNGQTADCKRVIVVVGKAKPSWWCAKFEGDEREAVRVDFQGQTFYLDNEGCAAWAKVTYGRGDPWLGHRSLVVEREVRDVS